MLELTGIVVSYGMIEALKGISLRVEQGEIVALIGANGAGKSTTLMSISGISMLQQGSIVYNGRSDRRTPCSRDRPHGRVPGPGRQTHFPSDDGE